MPSFNFNSMIRDALTGAIDFDTDSFKMMLVSVVPDATDDRRRAG